MSTIKPVKNIIITLIFLQNTTSESSVSRLCFSLTQRKITNQIVKNNILKSSTKKKKSKHQN